MTISIDALISLDKVQYLLIIKTHSTLRINFSSQIIVVKNMQQICKK